MVTPNLEPFQKLIGEEIRDDIGMILGVGVSIETEFSEYYQREFPVLVLDNARRIDLTYMKVED